MNPVPSYSSLHERWLFYLAPAFITFPRQYTLYVLVQACAKSSPQQHPQVCCPCCIPSICSSFDCHLKPLHALPRPSSCKSPNAFRKDEALHPSLDLLRIDYLAKWAVHSMQSPCRHHRKIPRVHIQKQHYGMSSNF